MYNVLFQGTSLTGTIITLEVVPTDKRALLGMLGTLVWALCVVIYAVAAYLMRNISWQHHQLIVGLSPFYYIFMPW